MGAARIAMDALTKLMGDAGTASGWALSISLTNCASDGGERPARALPSAPYDSPPHARRSPSPVPRRAGEGRCGASRRAPRGAERHAGRRARTPQTWRLPKQEVEPLLPGLHGAEQPLVDRLLDEGVEHVERRLGAFYPLPQRERSETVDAHRTRRSSRVGFQARSWCTMRRQLR